jgi:hypothetical protein
MTMQARFRAPEASGARPDAELARRAAAGDRSAFDLLFERYFTRVVWHFRGLDRRAAEAAIARTLERLFSALDEGAGVTLAARALAEARSAARQDGGTSIGEDQA